MVSERKEAILNEHFIAPCRSEKQLTLERCKWTEFWFNYNYIF